MGKTGADDSPGLWRLAMMFGIITHRASLFTLAVEHHLNTNLHSTLIPTIYKHTGNGRHLGRRRGFFSPAISRWCVSIAGGDLMRIEPDPLKGIAFIA